MIIRAELTGGGSGRPSGTPGPAGTRPVLTLTTDEFVADVAFYGRFFLHAEIAPTPAGPTLVVSVPDRRETLARIDPLTPAAAALLVERLPQVDWHLETVFTDPTGKSVYEAVRPGDLPFALDPLGDLAAWRAALAAGRPADALVALDRLHARQARFPLLPMFYGETHAALNDPAKAEEAYHLELSFRPGNFLARADLAQLYRLTGRPTAAREAFAESLRIYPNHADALLAMTYAFSEPTDLLLLLARAVRVNPDHPGIDRVLAEREADFGGMSREQILAQAGKLALKIDLGRPLYLPGLAREGFGMIDPQAGDLTNEEVFRLCLEEIMKDGHLEERERQLLTTVRDAVGISPEAHQRIFKEVELNYRKRGRPEEDALEESLLYRRVLERVLADGKVSETERALLRKVAGALLVTPDDHERLLKSVMADRGYLV